MSEEDANEALSINEESSERIKEVEAELAKVKEQPLKELAAFVGNPKQAKQILDVLNDPDGDPTLKSRWDSFRKQKKPEDRSQMSDVEALQNFMGLLANPDHKVTGPENRMIEKLRNQMVKDPERVTLSLIHI